MHSFKEIFSFKEHIESGKYEKRVWFWPFKVYVEPYALGGEEWNQSDEFYKKNYPLQFFITNTLYYFFHRNFVYKYKEAKWNIKGTLRNPRKEMRNVLFPIRWQDLTETIVYFHLQAIIEFVEREKCFDHNDYTSDKEHEEFAAALKECYEYAKNGRPALEKKLQNAYKDAPLNKTYFDTYGIVIAIEKEIEEYDMRYRDWETIGRAHV